MSSVSVRKTIGNFEIYVSTAGWPPSVDLKKKGGREAEFIHLTKDDLKDIEYAVQFALRKLEHGDA